VQPFLDTGFLLTILTHRAGAETAWALLKECERPVIISSLQLFFIRHGLGKTLLDPKENSELHELSVRAIKLLNWLIQQEIIHSPEIDYQEVVSVAETWANRLRTPLPSLFILWSACAAVSGARIFLSFDPRTRSLTEAAGLKVLPKGCSHISPGFQRPVAADFSQR
jgi:hypothetical protein